MKVLFDTSVIIAALLPRHPSHVPCFIQLQAAQSRQIQGYLSTHSLAEVYSVMTRMPSQPRMAPQEAQILLERCLEYLEAVPLERVDYQAAIAQMTALNLPGGGIFDALIAQAALKISADRLLTLNPSHFNRLNAVIARITDVPG
ncbi:type II toxin-antitoxin system VapC family toxin [Merismopedia glauca]|uniref:Ribonuclease VapC n=1 Tax=Merismopedia glauca CCAP 1448/3 TaxID=1296344 RepID=A0A2T1BYH3_9CYAN|nr:PIN domain-containing protein [Merismopedia glauca]PSB01069.1 VapC toxin family PIN domain ribonuclease [Merismopedia glauca CCAP 1448/3]